MSGFSLQKNRRSKQRRSQSWTPRGVPLLVRSVWSSDTVVRKVELEHSRDGSLNVYLISLNQSETEVACRGSTVNHQDANKSMCYGMGVCLPLITYFLISRVDLLS